MILFLFAFKVARIPVFEEYELIASLRFVRSEVAAVVPNVTVAEIACAVAFLPKRLVYLIIKSIF